MIHLPEEPGRRRGVHSVTNLFFVSLDLSQNPGEAFFSIFQCCHIWQNWNIEFSRSLPTSPPHTKKRREGVHSGANPCFVSLNPRRTTSFQVALLLFYARQLRNFGIPRYSQKKVFTSPNSHILI